MEAHPDVIKRQDKKATLLMHSNGVLCTDNRMEDKTGNRQGDTDKIHGADRRPFKHTYPTAQATHKRRCAA